MGAVFLMLFPQTQNAARAYQKIVSPQENAARLTEAPGIADTNEAMDLTPFAHVYGSHPKIGIPPGIAKTVKVSKVTENVTDAHIPPKTMPAIDMSWK